MSEYQYYEFVAVDGPISDEGMRYARGCSSRAQVSRFRWQNTYHFGDFHGSADTLLKYYDAHFYIANWGTVRFALGLAADSLTDEALRPYVRKGKRYENAFTAKKVDKRWILWWERNEEEGGDWTEGEGILDELIGVRAELLSGDYRALFLGWLADFNPDEEEASSEDSGLMPPIPPGLNRLSPALTALCEHLHVDAEALAVAAGLSEAAAPDRIPVAHVIDKLPEAEMRVLLQRVAGGDGTKVMSELNRLTHSMGGTQSSRAISCANFARRILELHTTRREQEAKAAVAKKKREEEARRQHLASIMKRADTIWAGLDPLMDRQIASAYDQAVAQVLELRDAHEQAGESARFQQQLAAFRQRYARRPAMLRRIAQL